MKVKRLRLSKGLHPLKAKDYFEANEATAIERLPNGDHMITSKDYTEGPVIVPHHLVEWSSVLLEVTPSREYIAKVPVSDLKR